MGHVLDLESTRGFLLHCGSSIPQIIVVNMNEEIGKLGEEVVVVEYGVWDLDGWPRI